MSDRIPFVPMGTASHPVHGSSLPVYGVTLGPDRIAHYTVQRADGAVLATADIASLIRFGYTIRWDPYHRNPVPTE